MSSGGDPSQLASLLEKDEDELFVLLAQEDPASAGTLFSAAEARAEGRKTFERLLEPLHKQVCEEWGYCSRSNRGEFADTLTLTAAIADVIVTLLGGIPAGTVAALLVKKGLSQFCRC